MSGASTLRRAARGVTWPVRRILEPRFADVNRRIDYTRSELVQETRQIGSTQSQLSQDLGAMVAASGESMTFVGRELRSFEAAIAELADRMTAVEHVVSDAAYARRIEAAVAGGIDALDADTARLIGFAEGHLGFAAQRGMWTNPPLTLAYRDRSVELGSVNERIVEIPYAFRALGAIAPGERILDFGSVESTVALSLAGLGYAITALDLRPYPFAHPNLEVAVSRLEDFDHEPESFAAVLCISTVEHVGLGWYGEAQLEQHADRRAMARLRDLTRPGGVLVLTVPYDPVGKVDDVQRTYDADGLSALLEGWQIEDRTIVRQADERTWIPGEPAGGERGVAMVTAVRPSAT
jgi:SAM-dependent methyltransferase